MKKVLYPEREYCIGDEQIANVVTTIFKNTKRDILN
jgi:hypothetical protein